MKYIEKHKYLETIGRIESRMRDVLNDIENLRKRIENMPREDVVTLVWSEGWRPVWKIRPKVDWINDPLFLEQQKEEPDDDLIEELLKRPKYQLSEELRIAREDRWEEPNDLVILDEDWGEQDPKQAEANYKALLNEYRPMWDKA